MLRGNISQRGGRALGDGERAAGSTAVVSWERDLAAAETLPEQRPRFLDSVGFRETDSIVFDGKVLRGNHGAHDFPHPQWGFIFSRKFREPVPPGRRMLWRFREPAQEKRVEIGILQKLKIMRAQERIIELE